MDFHQLPSDRSLKSDISDLDQTNSSNFIQKLKVRKFKFKGQNKPSIGFIAQEVHEINPHPVIQSAHLHDDSQDPLLYLSYTDIFVHSVNCQQQLVKQLLENTAAIHELKVRSNDLLHELGILENHLNKQHEFTKQLKNSIDEQRSLVKFLSLRAGHH